MELGRKFVFSVFGMLSIVGLTIWCIVARQPVPDGAIAAITTIVLAYTGTNVAATFAHNSSTSRTVSEEVKRTIVERRKTDDGSEVTD